jgi:sterol desaturase/sphingolipid hydroxylase (fatty acid hydroxylase superfamily)
VTTALRFHLGEVLVSTGVKAACIVALGVPPLGLAMFEMMLLAAAQFQHSNLRLPGPWDARLRALIVTPDMHRIHHSRVPTEHNANFGTIFSGWDRLIGTDRMAVRQEDIAIGLASYPSLDRVTFLRFWAMPFGPGCRQG